MLAEDIDMVFADESDFYYQLCKLLAITKVPVIMTASSLDTLQTHFIPLLLRHQEIIDFDVIPYQSNKPKKVDLYVLCMLIYMFETKIRQIINGDRLS